MLYGTNQNEKHVLALQTTLLTSPSGTRLLFRANSRQNVSLFLRTAGIHRVPRPGEPLLVEGHRLYVDTTNPRSWKASVRPIDVGIVYPLDSLSPDTGSDCIQDLRSRDAKKLILVTWTDNVDYGWLATYSPRWIAFDAVDKPDYHRKVKELEERGHRRQHGPRDLPQYARDVDPRYLVRLHCDSCNATRWAQLNKPYPGLKALHRAAPGELEANCLKCGTTMRNNYNWYGQT